MKKKNKGKFFVSNQGGLSDELSEAKTKTDFAKQPVQASILPLWEDVGGRLLPDSEKLDPGTAEEMKGSERIW